jgi:predicted glycoside hydrolase/deacetylase ChbG (UPF0249 family)
MNRIVAARTAWTLLAAGTAVAACLAAFGQPSRASAAQTWGERLGFSPRQRVLILHVNQLGVCFETNRAGRQAFDQRQATAGAVMMPAPWAKDACRWAQRQKEADLGLSVTFNAELPTYRWKPVLFSDRVRSLVDHEGFMWRTVLQVAVSAHADDVRQELAAQIERARAWGLQPSHLTLHLGALAWRPELMAVYLEAAHANWVPAVVVELTPQRIEEFRQRGYPLHNELIQLIARYPLPKLDELRFSPTADTYEAKRAALLALLRELPPGITQIEFRPAVDSDALRQMAPDWQQRVWDAQLLADPKLAALLREERFELTNWKELMRRFEGRPAPQREPVP